MLGSRLRSYRSESSEELRRASSDERGSGFTAGHGPGQIVGVEKRTYSAFATLSWRNADHEEAP